MSLTILTQRNFVADFLPEKCNFRRKTAVFAFLASLLIGLVVTYNVYLRLIGKRVMDFLLMLTEHFLLDVTAEALRANIDWKSAFLLERRQFGSKFQVQMVISTNHSLCRKTSINVLSCGIWMLAQVSFVLSQCMRLTDGQTDRRTDRKAFAIYTHVVARYKL